MEERIFIETKLYRNYIWIYFLLFFSFWSIRELWLAQYLEAMEPVSQALTAAVIKIVIWVVPVILFVMIVEKKNLLSYLGLNRYFKRGLKWAGWTCLALVIYFIVLNFVVLQNNITVNIDFNEWLNTIILVGFIEEIVFRGFLLKKLTETFMFWTANTITSILFVSIHFPIWFYNGLFEFPYIVGPMITAFILGFIFGFIYKITNSLWSVIVIHSVYNLLVALFN